MMKEHQAHRTRWVNVRFTPQEYQKLAKAYQKTTCRTLSRYIRDCLLQRPVVTTYRNASLDAVMEEVGQLKDELHRLGVNYNQVVKTLHQLPGSAGHSAWIATHQKQEVGLLEHLAKIDRVFTQLANVWLPE
ncbi:plasmid mobilization protein [Zhouia sp. PK063]|uniref:plasmid mobilization protein n=1 Tax=Zhouia sp. PK063 TaxID=3373602 RepID=UPI0037AA08E6